LRTAGSEDGVPELRSGVMAQILHVNLHREFFDAIARKEKHIEYRKQSAYRRKR
jgi:hypothetical protein